LHNEELHTLYFSEDRIIKSGRVRWAGYVACMGEEEKNASRDFGGKARRKETTRKT
jgi:hypothetical protein